MRRDVQQVTSEPTLSRRAPVFWPVVVAGIALLWLAFASAPVVGVGSWVLLAAAVACSTALVVHRASRRRPVAVVGDPDFCTQVERALRDRGYPVVGSMAVGAAGCADLTPSVGTRNVLVVDGRVLDVVGRQAPALLQNPGQLVILPEALPAGGWPPPSPRLDIGPAVLPLSLPARSFKRLVDLVVAPVVLVLCLPVLAVALIAIRLESRGSAIFKQTRVGAGGSRFVVYKLRTMYIGNDDAQHRAYLAAMMAGTATRRDGIFKLVDDPRITKVGRFLRRFSIDELPQLWNVIKGDMSLVGPRPALPHEAALYDARAWQRLLVKPGLTGLWQVSGRCELSFDDMVRLDAEYWRSWTPLLELKILLKSVPVVLSKRGAA